jgi:hypothetical protein
MPALILPCINRRVNDESTTTRCGKQKTSPSLSASQTRAVRGIVENSLPLPHRELL